MLVAAVATAAWALLVWLMTGMVRRDVLARGLIDLPTSRRMHETPTPRGGGLAVVAGTMLGLGLLAAFGLIHDRLLLALCGGLLVAAGGWWDDQRSVLPRYRLALQVAAATWAVWWLDGVPVLDLSPAVLQLGLAGLPVAVTGIVWSTNLFNFMDGIDGLAATEAVSVGFGGALLLWKWHVDDGVLGPLIVAASAFGFLLWNWQPAKVFMGDVGSGFLGFVFSVLALWSANRGGPPVILWGVLGMVFAFDATVTLLRRALRRERLLDPHCRHGYQRLVRFGWSHRAVSSGVLGLNLVLLAMALYLPPLVALGAAVAMVGTAYLLVERVRPM